MSTDLTFVDHIAIESKDIAQSARWYQDQFNCEIKHLDETWALLKFANISLTSRAINVNKLTTFSGVPVNFSLSFSS